jgi:hypothetical protein
MNGSTLGLGYHSALVHSECSRASKDTTLSIESNNGGNDVEALMQQYLSQCLEYHAEQELVRQQGHEGLSSTLPANPLGFVPAAVDDASAVKPLPASAQTETTDGESASQQQAAAIAQGRSRAQAILEKFRKQQEQLFWRDTTVSDVHSSITTFGTAPMIVTSTAYSIASIASVAGGSVAPALPQLLSPFPRPDSGHGTPLALVSSFQINHHSTTVPLVSGAPPIVQPAAVSSSFQHGSLATSLGLPHNSVESVSSPPQTQLQSVPLDIEDQQSLLFRQQRIEGFRREAKRKQTALFRNLEYVALQEEKRLETLQSQISTAKMQEDSYRQQAALATSLRVTTLRQLHSNTAPNFVTSAGIGTKQRKKVERQKKREGHVVWGAEDKTPNESHGNRSVVRTDKGISTVALYVTGLMLPIHCEATVIKSLTALFSSYGEVNRIHLYRDKKTGSQPFKGDGLVVYQLPGPAGAPDSSTAAPTAEEQGAKLINDVCLQVRDTLYNPHDASFTHPQTNSFFVDVIQLNGAELPDGSVLRVEPAHSSSRTVTDSVGGSHLAEPKQLETALDEADGVALAESESVVRAICADDDGDLDDFFDSI